jgi:hypothetical protein
MHKNRPVGAQSIKHNSGCSWSHNNNSNNNNNNNNNNNLINVKFYTLLWQRLAVSLKSATKTENSSTTVLVIQWYSICRPHFLQRLAGHRLHTHCHLIDPFINCTNRWGGTVHSGGLSRWQLMIISSPLRTLFYASPNANTTNYVCTAA